jgi:arsenate reductase
MKRIIVLCTGNSCRSQMAEGYLKKFTGNKTAVFSAGTEAHGLNPMAVQVMLEDGVDIAGQTSDTIDQYSHLQFDIVMTVCDHAEARCPFLPGVAVRLHKNFPDPAKLRGTEDEVRNKFRQVRDQIRAYCAEIAEQHLLK